MKKLAPLLTILALFIVSSYLTHQYQNQLIRLVADRGTVSLLIYLVIEIVGVILAPINTVVFIPIGVALWGTITAAGLSLVGWTIGSLVAYQLAKIYGQPLVRRFTSLRQVEESARLLPQTNLFWGIIALRILVPADLISYALGLFTPIAWWRYSLATFLGYIPSAVVYTYVATIPLIYQISGGLAAAILLMAGYQHILRKRIYRSPIPKLD